MTGDIILIALLSAFIIIFISKIGVREKVQVHGNKFFSGMFNCDFCISFWTCTVLSLVIAIFVEHNCIVLIYPLFATPITRILL